MGRRNSEFKKKVNEVVQVIDEFLDVSCDFEEFEMPAVNWVKQKLEKVKYLDEDRHPDVS